MAIRLKDIAADLGVTAVTVSRVLRNQGQISDFTRARVLRRAKQLGYRPNLAARGLVTGKSYLIGLVVPDLVHSFFSEVACGFSATLRSSEYTLLTFSSEQDPQREEQAIERLVARRVDALVVASVQKSPESFRRLEQAKIPYVLVDRMFDKLNANFVGVDDEEVGVLATNHLLDIGCRTIGHITAQNVSSVTGRLKGYKIALTEAGLPVLSERIVSMEKAAELGEPEGYQAAQQLLRLTPRPDAIFCYNDTVAMGAMTAVLDAGLRIPEDVALIGCANLHYSNFLRVPLSSIDQHSHSLGEQAAKLALRLIDNKRPAKPKSMLLRPRLVVRASTTRPLKALGKTA
jgi:LacI family transcriptional regulator, galactose operon repressor